MTRITNHVVARSHPRVNFASDREIMQEITEELGTAIGDIRYDSGVLDTIRNQIVFTLEDGRKLRLTAVFE